MSEQESEIPAAAAVQGQEHLKPLVESVDKSSGLLGPYDVSDHLRARVEELGLEPALAHFREHGYAVIEDVAPPEEMDALGAAIREMSTEAPIPGVTTRSAPHLLGRHPAVDNIATKPKILTFAEVSVGNGFRASQVAGTVIGKSETQGGIHADQNWLPAPFPEHNCVITFCIPADGMTEEEGATRVVPGSHLKRRHPTAEEALSETIAIETPKGGVAVWDGSVWHGTGRRTVDGERVVLHATYQRFYTQPIDDYSYLLKDAAYMASAPDGMREILGENAFFGTSKPGSMVDMVKFNEATIRTKL
jgi:ectoine hydroxylase-related dioxygenase (phytanoyl-CoA dioxygenase family)